MSKKSKMKNRKNKEKERITNKEIAINAGIYEGFIKEEQIISKKKFFNKITEDITPTTPDYVAMIMLDDIK